MNSRRIPAKSHYSYNYVNSVRVFSFAHQIRELLRLEPESVLEIGVGAGIVESVLDLVGIRTVTLDMQIALKPDVVASVTNTPYVRNAFDVVSCFQVLEHIPFSEVPRALQEIRRICRRAAIVSVPDRTRDIRFMARVPVVGECSLSFSLPKSRRSWDGSDRLDTTGHFWEVGCPEVSGRELANVMRKSGWQVQRTWRVPELPWHRFFILE